jgi:site-specific DNA-cytosine methylase
MQPTDTFDLFSFLCGFCAAFIVLGAGALFAVEWQKYKMREMRRRLWNGNRSRARQ